jgi:glycerate kinase
MRGETKNEMAERAVYTSTRDRLRVLIATDSFKGSLDAATACAAIARGVHRVDARAEVDLCPLADGGEGTATVLRTALGGEWIEKEVTGPLADQHVEASYLWIAGDRPAAVIDLAAASGLTLLPRERLDPLRATTYGTGELIADAIGRGARRVWLALGGSATVDGAAGLAMALGWRLLDGEGRAIGLGGGELERVAAIVPPRQRVDVRCVALHDVENRLLGPAGAARVFGPQKGAGPAMVDRLEHGLARLADAVERDLELDLRPLAGGGSAGGAGAGAVAFLGARLAAGARVVLRLLRFDARLRRCDLVITGEGRLDPQSLEGKVVSAVARAAALRGVPVAAVAGRVMLDEAVATTHGIVATEAAAPPGIPDAEALARAEELLEDAAGRLAARLVDGLEGAR